LGPTKKECGKIAMRGKREGAQGVKVKEKTTRPWDRHKTEERNGSVGNQVVLVKKGRKPQRAYGGNVTEEEKKGNSNDATPERPVLRGGLWGKSIREERGQHNEEKKIDDGDYDGVQTQPKSRPARGNDRAIVRERKEKKKPAEFWRRKATAPLRGVHLTRGGGPPGIHKTAVKGGGKIKTPVRKRLKEGTSWSGGCAEKTIGLPTTQLPKKPGDKNLKPEKRTRSTWT